VAAIWSTFRRRLRIIREHRRSLRLRLFAAMVGTSVAVFVAVDLVTLTAIQSFLMQRMDNTLARAVRIADTRLAEATPDMSLQAGLTPGRYYVGTVGADGTLRPLLPDPITSGNPPRLPPDVAHVGSNAHTAAASAGGAPYRVAVTAMPGQPDAHLVVALSLDEYETTLGRITLDLSAATAAAFVLLAAAGWVLTRRGLRALERIADRADTVTGGELSTRMDVTETSSEVGRLATALNSMLDRIEHSVQERDAAEAQMRQFMADASHELRTPLTTVRAYAELYEQGALEDSAAVSEAMRRISSEAARMGDLVAQLLTLARFDAQRTPDRRRLDLTALVHEVVTDARAVEPERRIMLRGCQRPAWVDGDRAQLAMLISNLLANVRIHAGSAAQVRVTIAQRAGHDVIEVADTGPGVPTDALPHLFDRFYRAAPGTQRGSGLGLAIVAAIVQAHGGHLSASHVQPHGLRISIELPEPPGPAAQPSAFALGPLAVTPASHAVITRPTPSGTSPARSARPYV
jgi:two-component system, OmpR family, sensor kinase